MFDRVQHPPRGRRGGRTGPNGRMFLAHSGTEFKAKGRQVVPSGERLVMAMPGGGGYGEAFERDPSAVREDVIDGLVTREAAQRLYGVVLGDDLTLDEDATRRARSAG